MMRITAKEMNIKPFVEDWTTSDRYMDVIEPIVEGDCLKEVAVALEAVNIAAKCDEHSIAVYQLTDDAKNTLSQIGYSFSDTAGMSIISWAEAA